MATIGVHDGKWPGDEVIMEQKSNDAGEVVVYLNGTETNRLVVKQGEKFEVKIDLKTK